MLKFKQEIDLGACTKNAREIIKMADKYKIGHVASALSYLPVVDYVFDYKYPESRPRKILIGKPHGALALYRNWLKNQWITTEDLKNLGSVYLADDQKKLCIPDIVYVANTLGNAIGVAMGMALSDPKTHYQVLVSDSSFLMGTTLEALMQLKRFKLKNLEIVVDWNNWTSKEKMPIEFSNFHNILSALDLHSIFTIFVNPKGCGVPEIEKEPDKWHY